MTPPHQGTFGDMGRNIFRDSGFRDMDFSVFKNFTWRERFNAQFRLEVFNVLNHPIPANPYGASNGFNTGNDPVSWRGIRRIAFHTGRRCWKPDRRVPARHATSRLVLKITF